MAYNFSNISNIEELNYCFEFIKEYDKVKGSTIKEGDAIKKIAASNTGMTPFEILGYLNKAKSLNGGSIPKKDEIDDILIEYSAGADQRLKDAQKDQIAKRNKLNTPKVFKYTAKDGSEKTVTISPKDLKANAKKLKIKGRGLLKGVLITLGVALVGGFGASLLFTAVGALFGGMGAVPGVISLLTGAGGLGLGIFGGVLGNKLANKAMGVDNSIDYKRCYEQNKAEIDAMEADCTNQDALVNNLTTEQGNIKDFFNEHFTAEDEEQGEQTVGEKQSTVQATAGAEQPTGEQDEALKKAGERADAAEKMVKELEDKNNALEEQLRNATNANIDEDEQGEVEQGDEGESGDEDEQDEEEEEAKKKDAAYKAVKEAYVIEEKYNKIRNNLYRPVQSGPTFLEVKWAIEHAEKLSQDSGLDYVDLYRKVQKEAEAKAGEENEQ